MKSTYLTLLVFLCFIAVAAAQPDRWQQRVAYKMDIQFDVTTHRFSGIQNLVYVNNSPDELNKVFYHLYFNAFQPGSMMDVRARTIPDPDSRVSGRIQALSEKEIGYQHIKSLKQNGLPVAFKVVGTILEVELNEPILPNTSAVFDMEFEGQVPLQIRRSGRDNAEGVDYSMAQWYPKMCAYDYQGWHANPYVGREFYGNWGDFDVTITIDKNYLVAASGYLQNPEAIGHGYAEMKNTPNGNALSWHFLAPGVHDFLWAADKNYTHDKLTRKDGTELHFFYIKNQRTEDPWSKLPAIMDRAFDYINAHFGQYPYKQYSFIQGGDGGMEYPMATLITGERSLLSLTGVAVHELMHSWYQMVLGSNESLYAWMDEGFTTYASNEVMNYLKTEGLIPGAKPEANPQAGTYRGYFYLAESGLEEPLTTHADHFRTNAAYGIGSYNKGAMFLNQIQYIIGKENFDKGILNYFNTWKFRHPNANDVTRIFEKQSGLELDWFKEYWVNTINQIDYGIDTVEASGDAKTRIALKRTGYMPMPIDLVVKYKDGSSEVLNIALQIMRGNKPAEDAATKYTILEDWPWTNPTYEFMLDKPFSQVASIEIDPSMRMADVNREDNLFMNK